MAQSELHGAAFVGRTIRTLRFEADEMSVAALATKAGVSRSHIHALEHGKANATLEVIERIAIAVGKDLRTFVDRFLAIRSQEKS